MPNKCCVPGCGGNYKTGEKVHIFSFPVVDDLRKKWLQAIKLEDFHPTKNTKVCASHFTPDDIVRKSEYFDEATGRNLSFRLKYPRLRNGAIPTQFLDFPQYLPKAGKSRGKSRKEKLLLAEDDLRAHEARDFGLRCSMPKPKTRMRTLTGEEPAANTRKTQPVTAKYMREYRARRKKKKIAALCVDPTVEVPDDGSSVETDAAAPFLKHVLANEAATVDRVEFVKEEEIDVKEEPVDKKVIEFDIKAEPVDNKNFVLPEMEVQCELGVETFRSARFKIEHQPVSASWNIASHLKVDQEEIQIKEEIL